MLWKKDNRIVGLLPTQRSRGIGKKRNRLYLTKKSRNGNPLRLFYLFSKNYLVNIAAASK
jgi:hypothetical protein